MLFCRSLNAICFYEHTSIQKCVSLVSTAVALAMALIYNSYDKGFAAFHEQNCTLPTQRRSQR